MSKGRIAVIIVGLLLVLGFGARITANQNQAKAPRQAGGAIPVVGIEAPQRTLLRAQLHLSGVVRPRNEVDVAAKVGGRVEELRAEIGQEVKAGQVLAVVEHAELALQKDQAWAQVSAAKAQLEAARIALAAAQVQHDRIASLQAGGALAIADRDRVVMELRRAEAGVHAAEAGLRVSEASAGLSNRALQNSSVTAPIAGVVVRRLVNVGAQVAPGQPLLKVQDVAELKLEGAITAREYGQTRIGQGVEIVIDELPGAEIAGRVAALSPTLDPQTRRAFVEVAIDNADRKLLPNMFARGSIELGAAEEQLTVPLVAVVTLPEGRFVFLARDGRARAVRLPDNVQEADERVSVEGLLSQRDAVIVRGQVGLVDGAMVAVEDGAR